MADDFDYYVGWGYSPIDPEGWRDDNSGWVDRGIGLRKCSGRRVGIDEDPYGEDPYDYVSEKLRKKWREEAKQKEKKRKEEEKLRRMCVVWETYRFYWKKKRSPIYAS